MAEEKIIYVEFASPFPPEALPMEAAPNEELGDKLTGTSIDFIEFNDYLHQQGVVRKEFSFGDETEKSSDRARFVTLYLKPEADPVNVAQDLNQRKKVIIHAIEARKLVPPKFASAPARSAPTVTPAFGNPLDEPLVRPNLGGVATTDPLTELDNQWYHFRCGVDAAWAQNVSGKGVIAANIDWGFLTSHQEFKDGELKKRIVRQRNTVDNNSVVNGGSAIGHGTAVLGILGAANNGVGIVGVAFDSELWAIQAGKNSAGSLDIAPWLRALEFVRDEDGGGKRKVVLLEVESEHDENIDVIPAIRHAIAEAISTGIVVCVPAGNGSRDAGLDVKLQAFPSSGSILVGATASAIENPISKDSNHGIRVAIYAPGAPDHDVTCSSEDFDKYRNGFGGTSGAAPKVAGTIALMLEANSQLSHYEIKDILKETGTLVADKPEKVKGTFLNAGAAVAEAIRRRVS